MQQREFSFYIDTLSKYAGALAAVLVLVLSLLVAYDAGMRYLFSEGSIALQEIEWHLFDTIFLLGLSYALKHDKHVRVDIFFRTLFPRYKSYRSNTGYAFFTYSFFTAFFK